MKARTAEQRQGVSARKYGDEGQRGFQNWGTARQSGVTEDGQTDGPHHMQAAPVPGRRALRVAADFLAATWGPEEQDPIFLQNPSRMQIPYENEEEMKAQTQRVVRLSPAAVPQESGGRRVPGHRDPTASGRSRHKHERHSGPCNRVLLFRVCERRLGVEANPTAQCASAHAEEYFRAFYDELRRARVCGEAGCSLNGAPVPHGKAE